MSTTLAFKHTPTKQAIELVSNIVRTNNAGLTTKEIFKLVTKHESRAAPAPPRVTAKPPSKEAMKQPGFQAKKIVPPAVPQRVVPSMRFVQSVTRYSRVFSPYCYRYLKEVVLPHMTRIRGVEKFHAQRSLSQQEIDKRLASMTKAARKAKADSLPTVSAVWLWRLREVKQNPPNPKTAPKVFGAEVGVGEDWSHLSKRRRRAREGKVERDVAWLRDLEALRRSPSVPTATV